MMIINMVKVILLVLAIASGMDIIAYEQKQISASPALCMTELIVFIVTLLGFLVLCV